MNVLTLTSGAILLCAVADDLRTRKIHNHWLLLAGVVALVCSGFVGGWSQVSAGLIASVGIFILCFPLFIIRAFGAGDIKLAMVIALMSSWIPMFWVLAYSVIWGAALGLVKAALDGQLKNLLISTGLTLARVPPVKKNHTFPFSVALLLGWMTQWTLSQGGLS